VSAQEARALRPTDAVAAAPRLGVGVLYNAALPDFLRANLDRLDYVSVIPDTFWSDEGAGAVPRYIELEGDVDFLDWLAARIPLVAHGIGLSIASAEFFDDEYVEQVASWQQRYDFQWHSDHLSFVRVVDEHGHDHNAGLAIPFPYDEDVLAMIAERVRIVQERVPAPFLLENNVSYIDIPDQDMSEPQFLNALTHQTGCGLLLDVHNVVVNARNHGFAAAGFANEIDLTRVGEVHVAGGSDLAGMYTDSHSGASPDAVWDLLEVVVAAATNLCGITFEFHESYYPRLKWEGIREELALCRIAWDRRFAHA
jgi:uncharacterized protein (UPF0276 family)